MEGVIADAGDALRKVHVGQSFAANVGQGEKVVAGIIVRAYFGVVHVWLYAVGVRGEVDGPNVGSRAVGVSILAEYAI